MFKISFVCDDKKLADALRGLMGIAVGAPEAVPVTNAVKKNGKVVPAGTGDLSEMFVKYAKANKLDKFKAETLREFCSSVGMSPTSYGYAGKQLVSAGVLKKHGTGTKMHYTAVLK